MRIQTKAQMYALYEQGAFGNRLRTWSFASPEECARWDADPYQGTVSLRYAGAQDSQGHRGSWAAYNVARAEVDRYVEDWCRAGAQRASVRLNESAPDNLLLLQGEVHEGPRHLHLRSSTLQGKMRDALSAQEELSQGVEAVLRLRRALLPSSVEDVLELLERYDGAVVEFSAYAISLGDCPGRNTIIWEVRHY